MHSELWPKYPKRMKALLCFVALLHFACTQNPSPTTCQTLIDSPQNCNFYSQCVETRATCGADGYALGYGDTYCRRFNAFSGSFNGQGQVWIEDIRRCLMQALRDSQAYAGAPTSPNACEELQTAGFNSHPRCYVDNGFCSTILLSATNLQGLFSVVDLQGPFRTEALNQVARSILRCDTISLSILLPVVDQLSEEIQCGFLEFFRVFNDPCEASNTGMLSIMFLLDASGSIGNSNFAIMRTVTADAAVTFAMMGARVGVVRFSSTAQTAVVVPLQEWQNTAQLRTNIEAIAFSGGGTDTGTGITTAAAALGSEGIRIIILFTDGQANSRQAAINAADAAKLDGISIYAGGIGTGVVEEELNSLASDPPEDFRVSVAGFSVDAFNEEIAPLIRATCLTPQQTTTGQQQQGTLGEGGILSLQYTLPSAGLTLTVNVAQGEVNIYGSYTIRNPTFFTADFMRSGSGVLQFHIPNIGAAGNTAFITLIAKEPVNTFTITATEGNTITLTDSVNCFDQCRDASCPGVEGASCVDDFCGGCNTQWFLDGQDVTSQCDDVPNGVGDDPHFAVTVADGKTLCYTVQGEHGFAFNLISNKKVYMNAMFVPDAYREEVTWLGTMGIIVTNNGYKKSNMTHLRFEAIKNRIHIDEQIVLEARNIEQITFENGKLKISEAPPTEGYKQPFVRVDLKDVELSFSIKFMTEHLDLYWHSTGQKVADSHGLIGQFFRDGVTLDSIRKLLILPAKEPVPIQRKPMWAFMERESGDSTNFCWVAMNHGYQGEGLIDGSYFDYLVDDVLSTEFKYKKL